MEAVSQPGTRVNAPPIMSTQSPGTKFTVGHEAPHDVRSPRPAASIPHYRQARTEPLLAAAFPVPPRCLAVPARDVHSWVNLFSGGFGSPPRSGYEKTPGLLTLYGRPAYPEPRHARILGAGGTRKALHS